VLVVLVVLEELEEALEALKLNAFEPLHWLDELLAAAVLPVPLVPLSG